MARLEFSKMQGVGNDFVVCDGRGRGEEDWAARAVRLCDRRFGVGADGLLVIETSDLADVKMRMFNPDGSPDVCGNGLRCVTRYVRERGLVASDTMMIEVLHGETRPARIERDGAGQFAGITVGMGHPHFVPHEIPISVYHSVLPGFALPLPDETLTITPLSTGSTHAVTFVSELPDDARFHAVSPLVEFHPLFPERTSLMWCVAETPTRLRLRIWERGAGETWGCGTGACAAAVAAIVNGHAHAGVPVRVASKGGELHITWREGDPIQMTGPAEWVFDGTMLP